MIKKELAVCHRVPGNYDQKTDFVYTLGRPLESGWPLAQGLGPKQAMRPDTGSYLERHLR